MADPAAPSPTEAERHERVKVDAPFEDGLQVMLAVEPEDIWPEDSEGDQ